MGAKHYTELQAWQLANGLKRAVYAATQPERIARDRRFCEQIRESAASAPANIAEGFGRYLHKDFARFLRQAISSLDETQNHIDDGVDRGHFEASLAARLHELLGRARAATVALMNYLSRTPGWGQ